MMRDDPDSPAYVEVTDSSSACEYGSQQMGVPGPTSGIKKRTFFDLKGEIVKQRKDEIESVKTLAGISTKFEIICKTNGEVCWRRYPCFCEMCVNMRWKECENKDLVGQLKIVVAAV